MTADLFSYGNERRFIIYPIDVLLFELEKLNSLLKNKNEFSHLVGSFNKEHRYYPFSGHATHLGVC